MKKNSGAAKILRDKLRKVGWKDMPEHAFSAGDVDTARGPKKPLRKKRK